MFTEGVCVEVILQLKGLLIIKRLRNERLRNVYSTVMMFSRRLPRDYHGNGPEGRVPFTYGDFINT